MISKKIENILVEKKISKAELGRRLDVNRQTISTQLKFWKDGGTPKIKTILEWSKALEISPEVLFQEISSK